tara:strand:+ start:1656 stop:2978 length:1323 start_codon:yes stop_codon:yes gene_type:complete
MCNSIINIIQNTMMNVKRKKISILGAGKSGLSAAKLASFLGADIFISDSSYKVECEDYKNFENEIGKHSDRVLDSNLIIKSPGIPNSIEIIKKAKECNIKIISEIEFAGFFTQSPIIGITGSNGKTTTVELVNQIFLEAGYHSLLGGNVGIPFSENVLKEIKTGMNRAIHILELSSFQLEHTKELSLEVGCILNISKDHLDRYNDFEDYIKTKLKIIKLLDESNYLIYNKEDKVLREKIPKNKFIPFKKADCSAIRIDLDQISLKGLHNISNISAALGIAKKYSIDTNHIENTLKKFKPLEHRLEYIDTISGVTVYNDSKATNIESMVAAIKAFNQKMMIIIIGGLAKKESDFLSAIRETKAKIKFISCYGESGNYIYENLKSEFNCEYNNKFSDAVSKAFSECEKGDILLLSPGCASYDQFSSYIDRGNNFKKIIVGLA